MAITGFGFLESSISSSLAFRDVSNESQFFSEINKDIDIESLEIVNKSMIFSRAYSYLSKLDFDNSFHVETLLDKASDPFLQACDLSIDYFTESEEYEKCSFIKKFKDFIEFSQNKLPL